MSSDIKLLIKTNSWRRYGVARSMEMLLKITFVDRSMTKLRNISLSVNFLCKRIFLYIYKLVDKLTYSKPLKRTGTKEWPVFYISQQRLRKLHCLGDTSRCLWDVFLKCLLDSGQRWTTFTFAINLYFRQFENILERCLAEFGKTANRFLLAHWDKEIFPSLPKHCMQILMNLQLSLCALFCDHWRKFFWDEINDFMIGKYFRFSFIFLEQTFVWVWPSTTCLFCSLFHKPLQK